MWPRFVQKSQIILLKSSIAIVECTAKVESNDLVPEICDLRT